ncbi:MAG: PilZ domain-containing protein [Planctomycetes bacterium]|nr:PilZ domain-containing protein [Planctomycetota bacterium]
MARPEQKQGRDLLLVDRRRARRAGLDGASVVVMVAGEELSSSFRDISRTGFAFTTKRRLGLGTEIGFDGLLHAQGDESVFVSCTAKVVRCERQDGNVYLVGCYFDVMSEDCRDAIDDFVEKVTAGG